MSLVRIERAKLTATALNNIAVATVVTAVIAPVVGVGYGVSAFSTTDELWWIIGTAWLIGGFALHLLARLALRSLEP